MSQTDPTSPLPVRGLQLFRTASEGSTVETPDAVEMQEDVEEEIVKLTERERESRNAR